MQWCPLLTGGHHRPALNHISLVNREYSESRNDGAGGTNQGSNQCPCGTSLKAGAALGVKHRDSNAKSPHPGSAWRQSEWSMAAGHGPDSARCSVSTHKSCRVLFLVLSVSSVLASLALSARAPASSSETEPLTYSDPSSKSLEKEYLQLLSSKQETKACTKGPESQEGASLHTLAFSLVLSVEFPVRPSHSSARYHSPILA